MSGFSGATAIAGIGATEFSKESGRSELQLACEAVTAAIADSGLRPSDVDGMVTFTAETSAEIHVARNVGIGDLSFFSRVPHGGGAAAGTVAHAAAAIHAGLADVVVCWRAFNERSGERYGLGRADRPMDTNADRAAYARMTPFGLSTPAQWVGMFARRYMHEYGATSEDFGRISVIDRARGDQPEGALLRAADHARGAPGVALDRRTVAPARLLPGDRRRPGTRRRLGGARSRPAARPGARRRCGPGVRAPTST
ncbi:hypothetical protein [Nocardioides sp. B-3]|uniref:hypothetical protein n=1 Tax=Nocardioides sp. B-3 TaxID=2895565 RepID=UPI00215316B8|nr:hypothetical protein [Nocardioides sp. B-3]UUZ59393.1 hypothetical protein LP418_26910 [Nocardioides sp. B-3]